MEREIFKKVSQRAAFLLKKQTYFLQELTINLLKVLKQAFGRHFYCFTFAMMSKLPSIKALISLIDDPDETIFSQVRDKLRSYGPEVIPYLESSWEENNYGLIFQSRIEDLVHEIQFEDVCRQLENWALSGEKDLLEGSLIIARYQYPGLEEAAVYKELESLRSEIWLEINPKQTAFEKVKIFNRIFYGKHDYHGNSKNFHSPLNSYINVVLETHRGNPLSLCIVYSIVAQLLDMPVFGVNLPNHFILAYLDEHGTNRYAGTENEHGVLFYINAFSRGTILRESDIKTFLDGLKFPHSKEHFEPCSNTSIIKRMIVNLIASFQQVGNSEKVEELLRLKSILEK